MIGKRLSKWAEPKSGLKSSFPLFDSEMRMGSWFTGAVVCIMFIQGSLSYEDKQNHLLSSSNLQDMGLPSSFPASVSYSVFLSALSGLQRTTQRKRTVTFLSSQTAMGMDLTDYLWNKAHEKHRAMVLQRMMKNGKR
ncbi:uncharacterized protein TNCT_109011 [Trichonephila clavata]|uniref:Uncharacterized protein n=2 Tax=Trichonephila TaxID=2585208 RepID=A0A8X6KAV8_TRICU|nr:uncharacterized protein TNCT_109011 [Trichonephila clavata]